MATFAALFGLALLDSINFSAIVGTLYILISTERYVSRVLTFLSALFATYLAFGIAMISGANFISSLTEGNEFTERLGYGVEGVVGAVLLIYGIFGRTDKKSSSDRGPKSFRLPAVFLAGITVSLFEVVTALPYLGALAILTRDGYSVLEATPILVVYNFIFVLPCLLLLAIFHLSGERLRGRFQQYVEKRREKNSARKTFLLIVAIVGFLLLRDSLYQFEFFGLVDIPDNLPGT